jgi:hypothetical protein
MGDMCYKNEQKVPKLKTTLAKNGKHVMMVASKINCYLKSWKPKQHFNQN